MTLNWGDLFIDENGITNKYFPVHEGQFDCLQSEARIIAAIGGKNGGKSACAALWQLREIEKLKGKGTHLVVASTFDVVTKATKTALEKTLQGTAYQGTSGLHEYKLPGGGVIYFRSAEADYEGIKADSGWIDECGNCPYSTLKTVEGRLVNRKGARIFLSSTPYMKYDWLKTKIMAAADNGDKNYFYRVFPSWLNPASDMTLIEKARKEMPTWEFEMNFEGKFSKMPGLVYDPVDANGKSCFVDMPDEGLPEAAQYVAAVDFGGTDPHCWLLGLIDYDDCLWIIHEHYAPGDILELFDSITGFEKKFKEATGDKIRLWTCDHQKNAILALRKLGVNAKPALKGPESISLGISLVQARIRRGKLKIVTECCPNLHSEFLTYRYLTGEDGNAVGNKPMNGQKDHACLIGETLIDTIEGPKTLVDLKLHDLALTRSGYKPITAIALTQKNACVMQITLSNGHTLTGTPDHPVWAEGKDFCRIDALRYYDRVCVKQKYTKASNTDVTQSLQTRLTENTSNPKAGKENQDIYIGLSGKKSEGSSPKDGIFITRTATQQTIQSKISNALVPRSISEDIPEPKSRSVPIGNSSKQSVRLLLNGTARQQDWNGTENMPKNVASEKQLPPNNVIAVEEHTKLIASMEDSAIKIAKQDTVGEAQMPHIIKIEHLKSRHDVYNITVGDGDEYYANDILVKNCDGLRYLVLHLERKQAMRRDDDGDI
ncbi:MAG: hypothetical protein KGZ39_05765 [Simkania sp.]|nr:hypothetical protein [Simkania sp.]